jgi:hypothetical protein
MNPELTDYIDTVVRARVTVRPDSSPTKEVDAAGERPAAASQRGTAIELCDSRGSRSTSRREVIAYMGLA